MTRPVFKCESINDPLSGTWVFLNDKQNDQSNSSVEHSQFIFYLYDHVEYLRCDYATGRSASPSVIKDIYYIYRYIYGAGWIDMTKL